MYFLLFCNIALISLGEEIKQKTSGNMYITFHLLLMSKTTSDSPCIREETCVVISLCLGVLFFTLWSDGVVSGRI